MTTSVERTFQDFIEVKAGEIGRVPNSSVAKFGRFFNRRGDGRYRRITALWFVHGQNHGCGVDSYDDRYLIRAWGHGEPIFDVEIWMHRKPIIDDLLMISKMVGLSATQKVE